MCIHRPEIFFIRLSYALTGHRIGGPAKVAVVGSGFMGMVSGAAAANVATTGAFTIPLMKRVGYKPEFAGAVEASASMGGQFMPPIMGAAAFIIAEQLRIPYGKLCLYALVPALLHFFAVFMMVHFRAQKRNLPLLSRDEMPDPWELMRSRGQLLLPLVVIITLLVIGYTPQASGFWAIVSVLVLTGIKKSDPYEMGYDFVGNGNRRKKFYFHCSSLCLCRVNRGIGNHDRHGP